MKKTKGIVLSIIMLAAGLVVAWSMEQAMNIASVEHRGVLVFLSEHLLLAAFITFFVGFFVLEIFRRISLGFVAKTESVGAFAVNAVLWPVGLFLVFLMMDFRFELVAGRISRATCLICVLWMFDAIRIIRRARSQREFDRSQKNISVDEDLVVTNKTSFEEVMDANSSKMEVKEDCSKGLLSNTDEVLLLQKVAEMYSLETKILFGKFKNAKIRALKEVNVIMSICIASALYVQKKEFHVNSVQTLQERYLEMMKLYLFENDFVEDLILAKAESILQAWNASEKEEALSVAENLYLAITGIVEHTNQEAGVIDTITSEFVEQCTRKLKELKEE